MSKQVFATKQPSPIRCSSDWNGPFGVPPFGRIEPQHFPPAFARAFAAHEAEVDAIADDAGGADLRQHHRGARSAAAKRSPASIMSSMRSPGRTPTKRYSRSSGRWRRSRPGIGTGSCMNEALFRRIDALHRRARPARPHGRAEARARSLSREVQARRRRARRRREAAARRDQRAARYARHGLQPERAGGRAEATRSCSTARTTSPGFPISCARRRRRRPTSAASPASM